ncbi:MAG: PINIT domain-containing protein [Benjaminiella poitrasii]|nr:MAG: PINIT domain-containing protein [Benjaminiella poitrasii]
MSATAANLESVQNCLKLATVKEMTDCIKELNKSLHVRSKLQLTGRKEDKVRRISNYIISLMLGKKISALANLITILNNTAPNKFHWKLEDEGINMNGVMAKANLTQYKRPIQIDELTFYPSPFLKPVERLTSVKICPASNEERHSKVFQFTLSDLNRQLLATPNAIDNRPPFQIRFYCSKYTGNSVDLLVEFPAVCELRVNDGVIPGNHLRCLKGKPGTVNPPDLSIMIRKQAVNNVELVYVNSDTPFIAGVYIVERTSVNTLIDKMREERFITKEEVLEKLQQTQEDTDIIMESETLSTKDPLAFSRIITPIRSNKCQHLQCFDASVYLMMNEQTPTWTCPVCYRRIESWEDLFVDGYFTEMLQNTPKHIDSVRVEPNGHITIIDEDPELTDESDDEETHPLKNVKSEEKEVATILLDDDDEEEEVAIVQANTGSDDVVDDAAATDINANTTTTTDTDTVSDSNNTLVEEATEVGQNSGANETLLSNLNNTSSSSSLENDDNIPITVSSNNSSIEKEEPVRKKQKVVNVIDLTLDSDEDDDVVEVPHNDESRKDT